MIIRDIDTERSREGESATVDSLDEDSRILLAVATGGFAALTVALWSCRLAYAHFGAPLAHLLFFLGLLLGICLGVGLGVLVDTPSKTRPEEDDVPVSQQTPLADVEEEMREKVAITGIANKQACQSYININRQVSEFWWATEQLEHKASCMSPETKRELHLARLAYFERLQDTAREGQQIIRSYLSEI